MKNPTTKKGVQRPKWEIRRQVCHTKCLEEESHG